MIFIQLFEKGRGISNLRFERLKNSNEFSKKIPLIYEGNFRLL